MKVISAIASVIEANEFTVQGSPGNWVNGMLLMLILQPDP